ILRVLDDGVVRNRSEIYPLVAKDTALTDEQMKITLSSGQQLYRNRTGWGLSFLAKVGALHRPSRGHYTITDAGRQLLKDFPNGLREQEVRAMGEDPDSPIQEYVATLRKQADKAIPLGEDSAKT